MRSKLGTKVGGSFVLGALAMYALFAFHPLGDSSSRAPSRIASAAASTATPSAPVSTEAEEMRRNFAAFGRALLTVGANNGPPPVAPAPEDPQLQARATLDERLASAPASPREAARLQAELQAILNPTLLDGAAAAPVCGSTMCRVDIADADDAHAQRATNGLLERLPKTFAAATVYSKNVGERTVYVAKAPMTLVLN
jgi:hypothetical protein